MNAAVEALAVFLASLLPGWRVQRMAWHGDVATDRYAVIRPVGGARVELVRRPQITVALIGADGEGHSVAQSAAESLVQALRTTSAGVVSLQPAEPVFVPTSDGRAVFEIAISAITV